MAISGGISGADSSSLTVDERCIENESKEFVGDSHSTLTESIREIDGGFDWSCSVSFSISLRFPSTTICTPASPRLST
jgi:hypothetical protein